MLLAHHENKMLPLADSMWDWFRPAASTVANDVDYLFWGITVINIIFFVLIVALMVLFVVWYRKRPGHQAQHSPHHNNTIEAVWSIVPLFLVLGIFYFGFTGFMNMRIVPDDAYEINVRAKKWNWAFTYPNGVVAPDLHVPVDRPVKLVLSSDDVIHSLFIPAFRVKMDCVPGRYNKMWFTATKPSVAIDADGDGEYDAGEGGYDLFCTEYCGTQHSSMIAKVHVYESDDAFAAKMDELSCVRTQGSPAEVGEALYASRGCKQCHSNDGTDQPANGGPSFKGHYGKPQLFTDGSEVMMDENYIRESIIYPQKLIRKGYRAIMPTYQGQLNDDELTSIIAYIKQLNGAEAPDWASLGGADCGDEGEPSADVPADDPDAPTPTAADQEAEPVEPSVDPSAEPTPDEAAPPAEPVKATT